MRKTRELYSGAFDTMLLHFYRLRFYGDDHPSRETSRYIDEMLLMDHEPSKFMEEWMFEANDIAVFYIMCFLRNL